MERDIARRILKQLNAIPQTKAIKLHGSAYSEAGTPDILCVRNGQAYLIEVKRPGGKKPSAIQDHRMAEWRAAGAVAFVARSVAEAVDEVLRNDVPRGTSFD